MPVKKKILIPCFKPYLCSCVVKSTFKLKFILTMSLLNVSPQMLMGMPNSGELIILLLIIVVLFGGKKIPELAKGLGKGIREFNDAKDGIKNEIENGLKEKDKVQPNNNSSNS